MPLTIIGLGLHGPVVQKKSNVDWNDPDHEIHLTSVKVFHSSNGLDPPIQTHITPKASRYGDINRIASVSQGKDR